ncbi:hypothetical protein C9994_11040 [Marivirga lumbricoides]|uniref:Uncharacterized protein n=1 Tax=Marivirga lumbricoides TaxID=1046115 RepID=A0A2T4DP51_9BACT|nr:hypothetical protein C9994_11040 [Marivirga lumbricoides]
MLAIMVSSLFRNSFKFIFFLFLFHSCAKKEDVKSSLQIENRNSGLIGEQITDYNISPVDSSIWILQCENRAYLTTDKGLNWSIIDAPDNCSQYNFDNNGDIISTDGHSFYKRAIQKTKWAKIITPDSLNDASMMRTAADSLVFILRRTSNAKPAYLYNNRVFSKSPIPLNKNQMDSVSIMASSYKTQKYLDSTFINLNSGHLLYADSASNTISKRMNGIQRPEIVAILQDENQPNKVSAIQVSRNHPLVIQYYWLYTSEDFGKKWLLNDSASDYKQLLELVDSKVIPQDTEQQSRLIINDTLYLTTSDQAGGVVLNNSSNNNRKLLLSSSNELFKEMPDFSNTAFIPYTLSQYVFKVDREVIKLLFASKKGGLKYVEVRIDDLQNIEM